MTVVITLGNILMVLHVAVQHVPPQISMAAARNEAEMVLFDSVRHVLEEARLKPGQVIFIAKVLALVLCCYMYWAHHCFSNAVPDASRVGGC